MAICPEEGCGAEVEFTQVQKEPIVLCPRNPSEDLFFVRLEPLEFDCPFIRSLKDDNSFI